MAKEFRLPTPDEIEKGIFKAGIKQQQAEKMMERIEQGMKEGTIRTDLTCFEHKERFFEMANRMYAKHGRMRLKDAEIGIHEGKCQSPLCLRMRQTYFEILKPSQVKDSMQIDDALVKLEWELMIGKERIDLKNKTSAFYDPDTGKTLKVVKAVDITDKCRLKQGHEALLVYIKPMKGIMVDIQEHTAGLVNSIAYGLGSGIFTPEDKEFRISADSMKIDPNILHAIIIANAPRISQSQNYFKNQP